MTPHQGEDVLTELETADDSSSLMVGLGASGGVDDHSDPQGPLPGVEASQATSEEHAGLASSFDPSSQNESLASDLVSVINYVFFSASIPHISMFAQR